MAQATIAAMPTSLGHSHTRPAPRRGRTLDDLRRSLLRAIFDPYRPELHYMRGPGPKWREKHGDVPPPAL